MIEVEELQGFESACRLCLTTDETRSSIFGAAHTLDPLVDKIKNCLSVQISQEDKLSTLICITCVNKVNQWHQYKESCLQSQEKLIQWLANQSIPIAVVTVKKEPVSQDFEENLPASNKDNNLEKPPEKEVLTTIQTTEIQIDQEKNTVEPDNLEEASKKDAVKVPEMDVDQGENEARESEVIESTPNISESANEIETRMEIEQEKETEVERETRGSSKRRLSKDSGNENKRLVTIPIKNEPQDEFEVDENLEIESTSGELLLNPLAMANNDKNDNVPEVAPIQKSPSSLKGKKKVRRGPHTHFRGARIFKRKCLHCQINLHSKNSYAKHMARFHSVVGKSVPQPTIEPESSQRNDLVEEAEELIEDVEEELENLGEDAPLTPVQQNIISQLKTFSCYSCEQSFQDRRSTLNHIRQHMPDLRSYTCVACLTEFSDRTSYKQHCEASFECAMKIALVVPIQGVEKYFTCNMCLRPMPNRKDLISHLSKHSDKQYEELMSPAKSPPKLTPMGPLPSSGPYGKGDPAYNHECDLCGMIYRYKPNMIKHRELCASLQPEGRTSYKCVDCGMTFLVFSKFHSHVTLEHKKKELKCPKCAAKFRSPSDYLTHHEFHRKKNDAKESAQKNWSQDFEKTEGENLHLQSKAKKFACSLCNLHFSSRAELTEHRNLHLKVKIYSCVICRSMFSSPGALEIHMKDHGIDDPTERTANSSCMEYGQEVEAGANPGTNNSGQNRKNECFDCGKTFSNLANLRRHVRNAHGEERRIDCTECARTFKNKESFDEHMRNAHNSSEKTVLTCPQCPKTFVFQANLDLHLRNAHVNKEKGSHECDICGKTFVEESSLKIHRGWHNRANSRFSLENYERDRPENSIPGSSKPAKARKSFPNSSPVQQQPLIELQCQVCDDKFVDVADLRKHVWDVHCARTTKPEKPFLQEDLQCELCTNVFPDQQSLEIHMEWHERNPILNSSGNYRCDICDKYYSSSKILWKHKKLHKVSQALKFQSLPMKKPTCNPCGRTFTAESSLKRHKAMSPECQTYFTGRGLADQELRSEDLAKKRPVTCHICKTVFPSMSVLYQHKQLVHKTNFRERKSSNEFVPLTSVEGVSCNVCGKQFPGVSNLKQHFTIKHKNVSKHPCTIANCKMIFSTPHALKNHELTHSNMIYSCSLCERHFFHKGVIEKHIFNAHRAVYQTIGAEKESLYKETDLSTYVVKGATGTVCPRCKIKYPNIKAMKIHYFKFHEAFA